MAKWKEKTNSKHAVKCLGTEFLHDKDKELNDDDGSEFRR